MRLQFEPFENGLQINTAHCLSGRQSKAKKK